MPWSTKAEARRHNKGLSDKECEIWLAAANAALKTYKDDGRAVRTGNAAVSRYRAKHRRKMGG